MRHSIRPEVIQNSTSKLLDDDLKAIAVYLKDQPPPHTEQPSRVAQDDPAMKRGQAVYVDNCAACHAGDGRGVPNLFPTLKDSPVVQAKDPTTLLQIAIHGTRNVATDTAPTAPAMPAFGWRLSDDEIAAVLTYIRNSWGNAASAVAAGDVAKRRPQLTETTP